MEEDLEEMFFCDVCKTHYLFRNLGRSESCNCKKVTHEKIYESKEEKESKFSEMMNEIYAPLLKDKK